MSPKLDKNATKSLTYRVLAHRLGRWIRSARPQPPEHRAIKALLPAVATDLATPKQSDLRKRSDQKQRFR